MGNYTRVCTSFTMHVFWTIPPLYIILCRQGQSSGIMNVSFKSIHHFVEYLNVDQSCGSVLTGQLLHSHLVKFPQPPFPLLPVLHPFINSSPSLRPTRTSSISPPCSSHRSSCYRTTNFNNSHPPPPPPLTATLSSIDWTFSCWRCRVPLCETSRWILWSTPV